MMDYASIPGTGPDTSTGLDGDSVQMIPEIAAAAAARTGGVPLIADANGTIVLPAGATLDDIKVVGRDLVITLDNGQVFVIPEGAVYVPQIVIDGVAVPPLNLAALLIGDEPIQPAAGLPNSSGNNFFEDAGPIQAAHPVGDLLPPTEFGFVAEQNLEIIPQPIDRNPTQVIVTPNQPAGATDATANVAESGLPARNGEPAGSNAAANTETTGGTIVFSSPDGIASFTVNGTTFTGPGQTFTSLRGVLTITSFDPVGGTANFTYTLADNLVGSTVADQFTVVLTDPDGDVATSTLTINVADDAPTARNDIDAVPAGTFTAQPGNVITGVGTTNGATGADTLGADNASITRIASNTIAANTDSSFDAAGNLQVSGQYGVLTIKADGSYAYTRNPGTPGGVSDAFTYTLTDADGSASTATLTIAIADAVPVVTSLPVAGSAATIVAESGLPARTGEAPGSNAPAPTETTSGTITFAGGDGPVTATINGVTVAVGVVVTTPTGMLTVSSFDPVTGAIGYTFTLADNTPGDTTSVTFNLVVTDVDGDTAPGSFTITIADDVPLAVNDSATQGTENAAITVNALGNDIQGADSVAFSAVAAVPGTLSGTGTLVYNSNGTFTYTPSAGEQGTVTFDYTITDGDGDTSRATVTIALLADSTPTVLVAGDNTVSESALPARGDETAGSNAASPDETAAGTIAVTTGGDTVASLVINGTNVTTGGTVTTAKGVLTVTRGEGGAYSYSYTLADNTLTDPSSDSFTVTVTDSDGDTASTALVIAIADDTPTARDDAGSVAAGTYGPIAGSVTANDTPGADGIVVLSYARGETTGLAGSTIAGQYGTLSIAANGTYSYTRNAGTPGGVSDAFAYTVRDGDGDLATANLVITIADSGTTLTIPLAGTPGSTQVLEAGLPAGSAAATNGEFASGTFSFTAPDGPATVTIGGTVVTTVGQTIVGSFGTLTITSIANGAIGYTYQLTTNTSGDTTSDTFAVTVADKDNDSSPGTLTISIVDDLPTARADADSVKEDGPLVADGNVITGSGGTDANATDGVKDTQGADGAVVSAVSFGDAAGTVGNALAGTYGSLVLGADGSYTYTLNNANPLVQGLDKTQTLTETFAYTLRDGDGDTSPATLTITIQGSDDGVTLTGLNVEGGEKSVFETNLLDGSAPNAGALTQTGSFTTAGIDGIATIVVGGRTVFSGGAFVAGQTVVTTQGTLTITSVTPVKDAVGDTVSATVAYSYTLNDNTLAHTAAGNDSIFDSFAVTVTDTDGSTATDSLDVKVVDDVPTARPDGIFDVAEQTPLTIAAFANDTSGADGVTLATGVALATGPAKGMVVYNGDGSFTYTPNVGAEGADSFTYTIRDADGDTSTATVSLNLLADSAPVVKSTTNLSVDEDGFASANADATPLQTVPAEVTGTGLLTASGSAVVNFGADTPANLAASIMLVDNAAYDTQLKTLSNQSVIFGLESGALVGRAGSSAGAEVIRIALTSATTGPLAGDVAYAYSTTLSQPVKHVAGGEDTVTLSGVTFQVTDSDSDTATGSFNVSVLDDVPTALPDTDSLAAGTFGPEAGNVITGVGTTNGAAGADMAGADGARVSFAGLVNSGGPNIAPGGTTTIQGTYGTLSLSSNGSYTYTRDAGTAGGVTDTFVYRLSDSDGDTSPTTLAISIGDSTPTLTVPPAGGATTTVFEEGLPARTGEAPGSNQAATTETASGTVTFNSLDGASSLTINGVVFTETTTYPLTVANNATGMLTITAASFNEATGVGSFAYTYTLKDNTSGDTTSVGFPILFNDADGDQASATLTISIVDDVPTARADGPITVAEDAANVGGNLLANDTQGADGAVVTHVNLGAGFVAITSGTLQGDGSYAFTVGTKGTYTFKADGAWTFDPALNQGNNTTSVDAGFSYRITDGDTDISEAAQAIGIVDGANPIAGAPITLHVDDENLANGRVPSPPVTASGSIAFTQGSDSISTIVFDTDVSTLTAGNLTWTCVSGAEIVGKDAGSGLTVVTLDLVRSGNSATVTATLSNNFDAHPTLGDDLAKLGFVNVVATDSDGDFVKTAVNVEISDDVPTARDDTATQAAEDAPFAIAALANDTFGADGVNTGDAAKVFVVTNATYGVVSFSTITGLFTYSPNASAGSDGNLTDSFSYRIVDGDGDVSTATVSITLKPDSAPMVKTTTPLSVDEDAFPAHNPDGGTLLHPAETAGSNSLSDTSGSAVVNFGNDVPTGLLASIVLVDLPAYDTQLKTLDGAAVTFALESGALVGRSGGTEMIRIAITGATTGPLAGDVTYTYSTTLSQPVQHGATGEDTVTLSGITFQVTDRDADTTTGSFNVAVLDDVPSIDVTKGADAGVLLTTQDAETIGALTDSAVSSAKFGGVFALASVAGSDGTATAPTLAYALAVANSASGLTSGGVAITLAMQGATIVGSAGATPVFSIAVAADGTVTLSQFQQIDHAAEASPVPGTGAPFDDQFVSLADGLITLTASASITDRDGDTIGDSETVNIGANIRFADDGPVLSNVVAGAAVSVDETAAGVNFAAPVSMTSATAAITATSAFGADGAAASGATTYGLALAGTGVTSLQTAIGDQAITLVQTSATTITGQYGAALTAFTLTIGSDGRTTLTQNVALEHLVDGNTAAAYNDTLTLSGLVNATITIKDFDGDTATASTAIGGNVTFFDDGVDAVLDAGMIPAGSSAAITGNVLTNDNRGADGSAITLVANAIGGSDNSVDGSGNYVLSGQYGQLTLNATTGAYTYARTSGAGGGLSDVFTYTVTDNDGDSDTATLTIAIGDLIPVATTATAAVDDEGLSGGITGWLASGDIDANTFYAGDTNPSEAIFTGTLGGTLGDGTNTFLFGAALNATTQVMGQETVTYSVSADGSMLTATITASPDATRLTTALYTIKITDQTTGAYTVTLADNVLHANANAENDVDITVAYQLRDADLDLSTAGVLSIKFDDDIPTASPISITQATENASFTIPLAGQFAPGADGLATNGGITFTQANQGTVTLSGTTLTYTPISGAGSTGTSDSFTYTITDADGDAVTQTVGVTLQPDSVPTLSVTDVTVNEKGLAKGSGEFADLNSANNSDTTETATGTFTIATGSDTVQKVEVQAANGTFINVTAATVGSPVTVAGNAGTLTVTSNGAGVYSYSYTLTQNVVHTLQGAGDTTPGDNFAVRVTDSDNDVTTVTAATTINVTVIDDAPVVYAKDTPIQIANSGNVAGTGNFDFTVGADQRTDFTGANSDFGTIQLTGTVGTQTITPTNLVRTGETATSATFTFSFNYTASGNTLTENGVLTFDKTSGSYTVDLDDPIQASVSLPSVSGSSSIVGYQSGTSTVDSTQPLVTVAQITPQLFVQFTGYNGTIVSNPAPATGYVNGETLTGTRDFVSISGSANGVAGDTMGKGEVIDFDFFTSNPTGFDTLTPTALVSTMFVKFDGIGNNEDLIVILKVYDTVAMTYSTRALYVANGDIIKGTAPAAYSGITLDNNDGLIIIEPNDYRLGAGDANLVLVGAQITATDEGITGPAINFNGITGTTGASVTGQNLSNDTNDTGFKISDIGFLTTTTTIQNATLNFTFQLKDSEGDLSTTQVLTANVVNATSPIALDLDGGGVQFQGLTAGTTFNYGDDASRVGTAWVGQGDGLLAIDLDANHQVDSGKEIVFSTGSLGDLAGLAATYDTDHDGKLDAADADFARFGVWQDANGNGVSDAGEFHTLGELGIASISLVSDGVAYTAAGGDVTVAGSSTFTRADGSTGTIADAAFATAALDKLEAKTTELTATNAAAAGVLAAAAAVAALPVAAADVAPAATAASEAPAPAALQAPSETHEALRPVADTVTSHEAAKAAPAETASHGEDASASASNLAVPADHATSSAPDGDHGTDTAAAAASATPDFGSAGGQLMDALLAAAQTAKAGVGGDGPAVNDLAAVQDAFGDSHGAELVDAVVDHFAGTQVPLPAGNDNALADLFAGHVDAGAGFGPQFDLNQMLSDMSAHAAAQL